VIARYRGQPRAQGDARYAHRMKPLVGVCGLVYWLTFVSAGSTWAFVVTLAAAIALLGGWLLLSVWRDVAAPPRG